MVSSYFLMQHSTDPTYLSRLRSLTWKGLVEKLHGPGFLASWIFLHQSWLDLLSGPVIEGLATVLAGIASFWIVQDFPDTAKFLSEAERTVVVRRLQNDDQFSAAGERLRWKYIFQSLLDWKTWVFSMHIIPSFGPCYSNEPGLVIMYAGCDAPLYAFSLFLPTIINQVRFNVILRA